MAAAFSPCLPNPRLALLEAVLASEPSDAVECLSFSLPKTFDTNDGACVTIGATGTPATCVGRALFACSRQDVTERLDLAP